MRKRFFILFSFVLLVLFVAFLAAKYFRLPGDVGNIDARQLASQGQNITPFSMYVRGKVVEVLEVTDRSWEGPPKVTFIEQQVRVLLEEKNGGKTVEARYFEPPNSNPRQILRQGDRVVLGVAPIGEVVDYAIVDRYRLPGVGVLAVLFAALVLVLLGKKGVGTLAGLLLTIFILLFYMAPHLLLGANGPLVILLSTGFMAIVSALFAHGWNRQGLSGSLSNLSVVFVVYALSELAARTLFMYGGGSEESSILQTAGLGLINTRHVLLAAIMIGSLGALDDVTSSQTATVEELGEAAPDFSRRDLFWKAMKVGREHVSALVNTLALVYASASLPLVLALVLIPGQPIWVILNSESVSEQLVSILLASLGVVLAVPISTLFAVYLREKK